MRRATASLLALLVALAGAVPVGAVTDSLSVIGLVEPRLNLELTTATNSRCSAGEISFDENDADTPGIPDGNAMFMYSPTRNPSNADTNCHIGKIDSNSSQFTLSAAVTGTIGGAPLANHMDVFFGGFFEAVPPPNKRGGESTDWEKLDGFQRNFPQPFIGEFSANYRLRLQGASQGTIAGTVTYTLVGV